MASCQCNGEVASDRSNKREITDWGDRGLLSIWSGSDYWPRSLFGYPQHFWKLQSITGLYCARPLNYLEDSVVSGDMFSYTSVYELFELVCGRAAKGLACTTESSDVRGFTFTYKHKYKFAKCQPLFCILHRLIRYSTTMFTPLHVPKMLWCASKFLLVPSSGSC